MSSAERHYVGEQSREYHEKKRAIPDAAVPWVARLRAEKLLSFVSPTDTVFEFGAGFGWNLLNLRCARKVALEIADLPRDPSIEWVRDSVSVQGESADVVICHHALEHVIDPASTLAELRRILRGKGKLLLYVPFEKERRYREFDPSEPNHHLYSWNVQTLGNLVTECGFRVHSAEVGRFGYDRFAAKLAMKLKCGERGFRSLRAFAHLLKPASEVRIVAVKPG